MLIQLTRALTVANCDRIFHQFPTQLGVFLQSLRTFEGYFMCALGNVGRLPSDSDDCCSWSDWHAIVFWQKKQVSGGASKMVLAKIAGHYQCWSIILNWVSSFIKSHNAHQMFNINFRSQGRKRLKRGEVRRFRKIMLRILKRLAQATARDCALGYYTDDGKTMKWWWKFLLLG